MFVLESMVDGKRTGKQIFAKYNEAFCQMKKEWQDAPPSDGMVFRYNAIAREDRNGPVHTWSIANA